IDRHNAPILRTNDRASGILKLISGQDYGTNRDSWEKWFTDLLGYAFVPQKASEEKPTIVQDIESYQPTLTPALIEGPPAAAVFRHSCFGAGTMVRCLEGPQKIESLRAGDQVLSQDTKTGALAYHPIAAVYHNPPNHTLRIHFGDD